MRASVGKYCLLRRGARNPLPRLLCSAWCPSLYWPPKPLPSPLLAQSPWMVPSLSLPSLLCPTENSPQIPHTFRVLNTNAGNFSLPPPCADKAATSTTSLSQAAPSFSQSLLRRGNQSLQDRFKVFNVPEPTLEWCVKAFSLYSPDCTSEIDPWEMKQVRSRPCTESFGPRPWTPSPGPRPWTLNP